MPSIGSDQIQRQILAELQRYSGVLDSEIDIIAKKTAQELIQDLKQTTAFKSRTGDYNKGWKIKKQGKKYIVHNKTEYRLTHLLEKGHAKRGGGRVEAKIHIAPAEDKAIASFLDQIERVVRR